MESSPNYEDVQVCNDNLVEDESHYILECSSYKVIFMKYDDMQDRHDKYMSYSIIHQGG